MSVDIVREYFKNNNIDKEILEFPVSSATVELAAQAVGVLSLRGSRRRFLFIRRRKTRRF